jgi:hypothetical protein
MHSPEALFWHKSLRICETLWRIPNRLRKDFRTEMRSGEQQSQRTTTRPGETLFRIPNADRLLSEMH